MAMRTIRLCALGVVAWLALAGSQAQAWGRWAIGVNIGVPVCYRPWPYDYYYYRPYPVVVAPAPVVVAPAPVAVQPVPPPTPVVRAASPEPAPLTSVNYKNSPEIDRHLQLLADPSEKVRMDAVMELGKLKAEGAVDPLAATLAGDHSPAVRDAAARALGLIGSPKGLTALKYAAQADNDKEVRHSAQFAVEVIHSSLRH
jgi:hypothetical protein